MCKHQGWLGGNFLASIVPGCVCNVYSFKDLLCFIYLCCQTKTTNGSCHAQFRRD